MHRYNKGLNGDLVDTATWNVISLNCVVYKPLYKIRIYFVYIVHSPPDSEKDPSVTSPRAGSNGPLGLRSVPAHVQNKRQLKVNINT